MNLLLFIISIAAAVAAAWIVRRRAPSPAIPPVAMPGGVTPEKVMFHIARFERGLEQCSNPSKRAELDRNLAYWRAVETALTLKMEI